MGTCGRGHGSEEAARGGCVETLGQEGDSIGSTLRLLWPSVLGTTESSRVRLPSPRQECGPASRRRPSTLSCRAKRRSAGPSKCPAFREAQYGFALPSIRVSGIPSRLQYYPRFLKSFCDSSLHLIERMHVVRLGKVHEPLVKEHVQDQTRSRWGRKNGTGLTLCSAEAEHGTQRRSRRGEGGQTRLFWGSWIASNIYWPVRCAGGRFQRGRSAVRRTQSSRP